MRVATWACCVFMAIPGAVRAGEPVATPLNAERAFNGVDDFVEIAEAPDIAAAGTVALWFHPGDARQGGMVSWTKGEDDADQRLVIALNSYRRNKGQGDRDWQELGVYLSDGENRLEVHGDNYHEQYFPPAAKWTHFAVSWDGQSIRLYRDGVLYFARFQTLTPVLAGTKLWLGRCNGLGGASDYFKGRLGDVRIYGKALSDAEVFEVYRRDAAKRGKAVAVKIQPIVQPRAGRIFADIDYRAAGEIGERAQLIGRRSEAVATARVRKMPAWGAADVTFDASKLAPGDYTVAVGTTMSKVQWPGRAKGWEDVRVLNNLCWELLNVAPEPEQRAFKFNNPRKGWVYVITQTRGNVTLRLPGARPARLHGDAPTSRTEAMRWLPAGEHTIERGGDGVLKRLIVRSAATLMYGHYAHVGPGTEDDVDFVLQHILPHVNTIKAGGKYPSRRVEGSPKWWVNERGGRWIHIIYHPHISNEPKEMYDYIVATTGMSDPLFHGVVIDEFDPGNDEAAWIPSHYDTWIEQCRKIMREPRFAGRWLMPYASYNMYTYEKSGAFCRLFAEEGSYMDWEVYLSERETEDLAWLHINDRLATQVDEWDRVHPKMMESTIIALSYLRREYWHPDVNYNRFMDMQMNHLATRPEFFGLGGIEWYVSHYATEQYMRVAARLGRHYAMAGQVEPMVRDPYRCGLARNVDFDDGLDGWKVDAAETDSVGIRTYNGFGMIQNRYPDWAYTPQQLLWMKQSGKRANVVTQTVRGLTPGRLYIVQVDTGDYQELINGKSTEGAHAITIELRGAERVTDWYAKPMTTWPAYKPKPFSYENRFYINTHNRLFRATDTQATLRISDWGDEDQAGGPEGRELAFSGVRVQPYIEAQQ